MAATKTKSRFSDQIRDPEDGKWQVWLVDTEGRRCFPLGAECSFAACVMLVRGWAERGGDFGELFPIPFRVQGYGKNTTNIPTLDEVNKELSQEGQEEDEEGATEEKKASPFELGDEVIIRDLAEHKEPCLRVGMHGKVAHPGRVGVRFGYPIYGMFFFHPDSLQLVEAKAPSNDF